MAVSQSFTKRSLLPDASTFPSGLKATQETPPSCPDRTSFSPEPASFQMRIEWEALSAVAKVLPSALKVAKEARRWPPFGDGRGPLPPGGGTRSTVLRAREGVVDQEPAVPAEAGGHHFIGANQRPGHRFVQIEQNEPVIPMAARQESSIGADRQGLRILARSPQKRSSSAQGPGCSTPGHRASFRARKLEPPTGHRRSPGLVPRAPQKGR